MNGITADDTRPVLAAIRERGIKIDPAYAGECRQLFGNVGTRLQYQRKDGLDLDGVGELLVDRGFTVDRLSTAATLAILETLFTPAPAAPKRTRVSAAAVETAEKKARTMRLRKFACPECKQIARGTRATDLLCGRCYHVDGAIVTMARVDPLPEEILETTSQELSA